VIKIAAGLVRPQLVLMVPAVAPGSAVAAATAFPPSVLTASSHLGQRKAVAVAIAP